MGSTQRNTNEIDNRIKNKQNFDTGETSLLCPVKKLEIKAIQLHPLGISKLDQYLISTMGST